MLDSIYAFLGVTPDIGHMCLSLFFCNLFAFGFSVVPPKNLVLRHLFSPVVCCGLYYCLFRDNLPWHIIADGFFVYMFVSLFPNKKWMPWTTTIVLLLHLANVQWLGTSMHTAPMMMTAIKLSTMSWDVHDNTVPAPSLVSLFGYVFFFPGFFVGPPCRYNEYMFNIGFQPHHGYLEAATGKAVTGVLCAILWYLLMDYNFAYVLEPEFQELSFYAKLGFLQVAGLSSRLMYYIAWKLSESAYILSGLGFLTHSQGLDFSGMENVDIVGIETSTSLRGFWQCWNKRTSSWLRDCIYTRLNCSRPNASLITFAVSAFWHGIFPGYYLTFLTASFFGMVGNKLYRLTKTWNVPGSAILGWMLTNFALSYGGAPFVLLDFYAGLAVWKEFYFFPHIVAGLFLLL